MQQFEFKSKSSDAVHTVSFADPGVLACTCTGWRMKKPGKARTCKHVKDVIASLRLAVEERGEYLFADTQNTSENPLTSLDNGSIIISDGGKAPAQTEAEMAKMAAVDTVGMVAPAAQLASGMTTPVTGEAFNAKYGDGTWTMDEKLDGHRCVVVKRGERVVGWSRGGASANSKALPAHIVSDMQQMPDGIYDGELCAPGGNSWNVTEVSKQDKLMLVLFDVMEVLGEDVTVQPQSMRRQLLTVAVAPAHGSAVSLVVELAVTWANVERIWSVGGEGVILKKLTAPYKPGNRSDAWVKVKTLQSMVGTITGFSAGSFGPHSVTNLLMSNGVKAAVKTLNNATLAEIAKNPDSWIGRRLVVQFQQLTPSGSPRHPMWHEIEWDHVAGEAE